MSEAIFEYQCRRCGATHDGAKTNEKTAEAILAALILGDPDYYETILAGLKIGRHMAPALNLRDRHNCKDGGAGLSVFKGYRVKDE